MSEFRIGQHCWFVVLKCVNGDDTFTVHLLSGTISGWFPLTDGDNGLKIELANGQMATQKRRLVYATKTEAVISAARRVAELRQQGRSARFIGSGTEL